MRACNSFNPDPPSASSIDSIWPRIEAFHVTGAIIEKDRLPPITAQNSRYPLLRMKPVAFQLFGPSPGN
jgi:hypothetical protein